MIRWGRILEEHKEKDEENIARTMAVEETAWEVKLECCWEEYC